MARFLTTNSLIASIKNRAMIPENQSTFTTDDFIRFLNEELDNALVPKILQVHEDYFLRNMETTLLANTSNYQIPHRFIGNKLRDIAFKDQQGNIFEMTRISRGDISFYQGSTSSNTLKTFYVQGSEIVLVPAISGSIVGTLIFSGYFRPNFLVNESRAGRVTGVNTTTGEVSLNQVPDNFLTTDKFDIIESNNPHNTISFDLTPTGINTSTKSITFDPTSLVSGLSVGDYVMQSEETIIPQIPLELHSILAHRAGIRCLEALGDTEGVANASKKLAEMEFNMNSLIDDRVEEAPKKAVNRHSALRYAVNSNRFRG